MDLYMVGLVRLGKHLTIQLFGGLIDVEYDTTAG
jgi:hypothetical protein